VQAGHSVYVHCNGGKGRSAVCTLAYFISQGMSAADAYALVASQRRITKLPTRLFGFPRPQWRALLRYETSQTKRREGERRRAAPLRGGA